MKKVKTFSFLLDFSNSFLYFRDNRRKNRKQFTGLLAERLHFFSRDNAAFYEQFQPVVRFVQFLQGSFKFMDDIRVGFGAMTFTIVCANGCSRAKYLFT